MRRPLAVVGFTSFACLYCLSFIEQKTAAVIVLIASIMTAVLVCLLLMLKDKPASLKYALTVCLTVMLAFGAYNIATVRFYDPFIKYAGKNVTVNGYLYNPEVITDGKYYYDIRAHSINGETVRGNIRVLSDDRLYIKPYDKVTFTSESVYIPGSDTKRVLNWRASGIYLGMYISDGVTVSKAESHPLRYYFMCAREYVKDCISEHLSAEISALLIGLLIGDKNGISFDVLNDFRVCGISHLLVVSGLHLSLWTGAFLWFMRKLKVHRRVACVLGIVFIIFFSALTGFSAPVVRAAIMLIIMLFGEVIHKQPEGLNSLGIAVLLLLLVNPFNATGLSFIMSVFTNFAIVTIYPILTEKIAEKVALIPKKYKKLKRITYSVSYGIAVSVSAGLAIIPISATYFGYISLISVFANLIISLPAQAALVFSGAAVVTSFIPFISRIFLFLAGFSGKFTIFAADKIADIPFSVADIDTTFNRVIIIIGVIVLALLFLLKKNSDRAILCTVGLFAVCFLCGLAINTAIVYNRTEIIIPDAGNNSCVIIKKGDYSAMLGCGGWKNEYPLTQAMSDNLLFGLDMLYIPRDTDTESGLKDDIIACYKPKRIISDSDGTIELYPGTRVHYLTTENFSGCMLEIDGVRVVVIFYPASDFSSLPSSWFSGDLLIARADIPFRLYPENFGFVVIMDKESNMYDNQRNIYVTGNTGTIEFNID